MKALKTAKKIVNDIRKFLIRILISIFLLLSLLFSSGCANDNIVHDVQILEKTKLELPDPNPINMKKVNWIVITTSNYQDVFQDLQERNYDLILIGLTDEDYKNLSLNMSELKRFILEQKVIISSYKKYYESDDPDESDNPGVAQNGKEQKEE